VRAALRGERHVALGERDAARGKPVRNHSPGEQP
jgi:hypothetical protein